MLELLDRPWLIFILSALLLGSGTWLGQILFKHGRNLDNGMRETFDIVQGAALALLGLIIGFSFSMAIANHDARQHNEQVEANAISTEYRRLDFLPGAASEQAKLELKEYLNQRVMYYKTDDDNLMRQINIKTDLLGDSLWQTIKTPAIEQPTPTMALVISGLNDVLNAAIFTQASWAGRIPATAWMLMFIISMASCILVGYGSQHSRRGMTLTMILPLLLSCSLMMISDIDNPRGGIISFKPQNLLHMVESLRPDGMINEP